MGDGDEVIASRDEHDQLLRGRSRRREGLVLGAPRDGTVLRTTGYVEFRLGDYQHELGIIDSSFVPGTESENGRAGVVVYWHVDDVDAAIERTLGMGAALRESPVDRGQGFVTATVVVPFGNLLGLMYNPHYLEILGASGPPPAADGSPGDTSMFEGGTEDGS
jgi:predicted enzyme related to lactoylglutathione lyase